MTDNEKILAMLETMQTDISGLKQGQAEIKQDLTYLKEDVEIVRQVAVKTEHELEKQTMILREGYYDNKKLADNYEPRIENLEETVENLSIDVNYLKSVG